MSDIHSLDRLQDPSADGPAQCGMCPAPATGAVGALLIWEEGEDDLTRYRTTGVTTCDGHVDEVRDVMVEHAEREWGIDSQIYGKFSHEPDLATAIRWATNEAEQLEGAFNDADEDDEEDVDDIVRAKWTMDGAETLAEAADKLEAFATHLRQAHGEGFLLRSPVDGDYGFVYHPDGRTLYERS